jgi:hypothetical protein
MKKMNADEERRGKKNGRRRRTVGGLTVADAPGNGFAAPCLSSAWIFFICG